VKKSQKHAFEGWITVLHTLKYDKITKKLLRLAEMY